VQINQAIELKILTTHIMWVATTWL